MRRVGVRDRFCHSGQSDDLLKAFGLTPEEIVKAAKELEGK
jgi:transketolase C-terminal domain/subunit